MVWEACSGQELSVRLPIPAASWSGGRPPSSAGFPSPYLVFRGLRSLSSLSSSFFIVFVLLLLLLAEKLGEKQKKKKKKKQEEKKEEGREEKGQKKTTSRS
ncbi:hypothetical protein TRV_04124 [Trichophyton verrucosum HKI 0517]|uniref:Uncharacterized protein n=1 Tax=Trichophyton verrucosum (strain HKI 0517) TaxID=663202 RepID=D4DAH7_TRIVH|nr:uncharacterized protein TRV_04124 [Trichophyton verrucosum HKI 0517]EFE41175.1 hypothetical protein TRV_04124 [Trichophyton verrucosum HKI 0517]